MVLSDLSIKRPVFITMIMLAFVVLGMFGLRRLSIDEFPNVDLPVITVTTSWPGAGPESVESDVSKKIEEALNTVPGIKQISSQSLEGVSVVVLMFNLNIKINDAANDVREKLARIKPDLPQDAKDPLIERLDPADRPILSLALSSDSMSLRDLTELADEDIRKRLENVPGVGKVTLVGGSKREIEILLDPARLDLTLPEGSLLRGRVSPPPEIELRPTAEFRHPVGTRPLAAPTRWVPGAFQGPDAMPPGRPAP